MRTSYVSDGTWADLTATREYPEISELLSVGTVTGSMSNEQQGSTVPIVDGTVEGSHLDFFARMTEPVRIDLSVEGAVDGDGFTGTVVVGGGGTFPLAGWRAV